MVDNAVTEPEAREWISKLTHYLDLAYESKEVRIISRDPNAHQVQSYIAENFPMSIQSALRLLPTHILSFGPLYELLEGFKTDLSFHADNFSNELRFFPIQNEADLGLYAARVAGTVAELCLELVFHHTYSITTEKQREHLTRAGGQMGIALQYVNIARDIATDARLGRVYLPTSWLKEEHLTPQDVLLNPVSPLVEMFRSTILAKAFDEYRQARGALYELPVDVRAPMRVAVESYMEIGRVLKEKGYQVKEGKATVPRLRRLKVAWKALSEG